MSVPLLTNPFFLYDVAKGSAWAGGIVLVVMGAVFAAQREPELIPPLAGALGIALLVIGALIGLVCLVMYGGRWHVRFRLDRRGATWEQLEPGIPQSAKNSGRVAWPAIRRVRKHPERRVISLMNSWRVVLRLYCGPEHFEKAVAIIEDRLAAGRKP